MYYHFSLLSKWSFRLPLPPKAVHLSYVCDSSDRLCEELFSWLAFQDDANHHYSKVWPAHVVQTSVFSEGEMLGSPKTHWFQHENYRIILNSHWVSRDYLEVSSYVKVSPTDINQIWSACNWGLIPNFIFIQWLHNSWCSLVITSTCTPDVWHMYCPWKNVISLLPNISLALLVPDKNWLTSLPFINSICWLPIGFLFSSFPMKPKQKDCYISRYLFLKLPP